MWRSSLALSYNITVTRQAAVTYSPSPAPTVEKEEPVADVAVKGIKLTIDRAMIRNTPVEPPGYF